MGVNREVGVVLELVFEDNAEEEGVVEAVVVAEELGVLLELLQHFFLLRLSDQYPSPNIKNENGNSRRKD